MIESQDGDSIEMISPSQKFTPQVEVTDVPVEGSENVSDHAQPKALKFTVRGIFSSSPLKLEGHEIHETLPLDARDFFRKIQGEPVDVVTDRLGTFKNAVLEEWPHEVTIEDSLGFECRFKQVRIAQHQTVQIPPEQPADRQKAGAPDEQEVGKQPKKQRSEQKASTEKTETEGNPSQESDAKNASKLHNWTVGG
ncbi:MAG: phage baseplate protein [Bradymonadaceae bacterium]